MRRAMVAALAVVATLATAVTQDEGIPFGTAASRLHRGLEVMGAAMREHPAAAVELATERTA